LCSCNHGCTVLFTYTLNPPHGMRARHTPHPTKTRLPPGPWRGARTRAPSSAAAACITPHFSLTLSKPHCIRSDVHCICQTPPRCIRWPHAASSGLTLHQVASHCIKWPHTALDGLTLHRRPHAASSGLTLHQVASRSVGWLHLDVHRTCCYLGLADAVCFRSVALGAETPKFNL